MILKTFADLQGVIEYNVECSWQSILRINIYCVNRFVVANLILLFITFSSSCTNVIDMNKDGSVSGFTSHLGTGTIVSCQS